MLPRIPAVFTAKTHWRNYDHLIEQVELRENYVYAQEHRDVVQKQFEKEASLGAMVEIGLEQAQKELGKISVASLGALEKADGSYRVIHDATWPCRKFYKCWIRRVAPQLPVCEPCKRCLMPSLLSKEM